MCDVDVKLLASATLNLVCNNYVNSDVCEIFVNYYVTCDWLCWIMYDFGLYVGWIKILRDTRWTTGFIWAQVWWFDYLGGCYCTCALINWTVLWQGAPQHMVPWPLANWGHYDELLALFHTVHQCLFSSPCNPFSRFCLRTEVWVGQSPFHPRCT